MQELQKEIAAKQPSSYEEIAAVLYEAGLSIGRDSNEYHPDVYNMVMCTAFCR
jgi:hypothetical protein